MTDADRSCQRCLSTGVVDGDYCTCTIGGELRRSPRFKIGNEVYVFPPGTAVSEAQEVANESWRRHRHWLDSGS